MIILLEKQMIGSQLYMLGWDLVLLYKPHTVEMKRIKETFSELMLNHFQNIKLAPERLYLNDILSSLQCKL